MKQTVYVAILILAFGTLGFGGIVWDEGGSGDLSNSGAAPTALGALAPGSNVVIGTVGGADPEDWFTFDIGVGLSLKSISLVAYTPPAGTFYTPFDFCSGADDSGCSALPPPQGFVPSRNKWRFVPVQNPTAAEVGVGQDVFTVASIGPLGPGSYTLGLEDTTPGNTYRLDLFVNVPEPGTYALVGLGLMGLAFFRRRRRRA